MKLINSISHQNKHSLFNPAFNPPLRVSMAHDSIPVSFQVYTRPFPRISSRLPTAYARKRNPQWEPVVSPSAIEDATMVEEDIFLEQFEDDELADDDSDSGDQCFAEEAEPLVGDGAGGGGVSLSGTVWDERALDIAEEVAMSFDGELGIYAFRTQLHAAIQIRIERLTNKSGSPSMKDLEDFTTRYQARLGEAEATTSIPPNIYLEVSSPGTGRVVRIPEDLERFGDSNFYVKYTIEAGDSSSFSEHDGVFRLVSYDSGVSSCTWGLADVRVNREKSGKGRPLSKKQREWRLETRLDSLRLVRFYCES